jgi:hypothetical protein
MGSTSASAVPKRAAAARAPANFMAQNTKHITQSYPNIKNLTQSQTQSDELSIYTQKPS